MQQPRNCRWLRRRWARVGAGGWWCVLCRAKLCSLWGQGTAPWPTAANQPATWKHLAEPTSNCHLQPPSIIAIHPDNTSYRLPAHPSIAQPPPSPSRPRLLPFSIPAAAPRTSLQDDRRLVSKPLARVRRPSAPSKHAESGSPSSPSSRRPRPRPHPHLVDRMRPLFSPDIPLTMPSPQPRVRGQCHPLPLPDPSNPSSQRRRVTSAGRLRVGPRSRTTLY